jgi:hypothetical protein
VEAIVGDLNSCTFAFGENMMHAVLLKFGMRMGTRLCREEQGGAQRVTKEQVVAAGQSRHISLPFNHSVDLGTNLTTLWHQWFDGVVPANPYNENLRTPSGWSQMYGSAAYYLKDKDVLMSSYSAYRLDRIVEDFILGPCGTLDLLRNLDVVAGRDGNYYDSKKMNTFHHVRILRWNTPWSNCRGFPREDKTSELLHPKVTHGCSRMDRHYDHQKDSLTTLANDAYNADGCLTDRIPRSLMALHVGVAPHGGHPSASLTFRGAGEIFSAYQQKATIQEPCPFTLEQIRRYPVGGYPVVVGVLNYADQRRVEAQFNNMKYVWEAKEEHGGLPNNAVRDDEGRLMNAFAWKRMWDDPI